MFIHCRICAIFNKCTACNWMWQTWICICYKIKNLYIGGKKIKSITWLVSRCGFFFFAPRNALLFQLRKTWRPGKPFNTIRLLISITPLCYLCFSYFSPFANFLSFTSEIVCTDSMDLFTWSSRWRWARWEKPGTLRQVSSATSAPLLLLHHHLSASSLLPCAASTTQTERRREKERRRHGFVLQLSHMIKQHHNLPQVRRN